MGDRSSAVGQIISPPKGGGALRGIGEKFTPDLYTGTGNFTVPITVPPGRNGLWPDLRLAYGSGTGNGPFGLGWSLSVPGVTRKTSRGVPTYDDSRDTFLLSGAEDLVPVGSTGSAIRYRPRTEGLFARIEHIHDKTDDYWDVHTGDGLISRYGSRRPEDAEADWRDLATIADPDRQHRTFAWRLTRTTDPFGNRIEYVYETDPVQREGSRRWDQLYLKEIRYADHGDKDDPLFLVGIRFVYEPRPDMFSDYRAGFEIRTARRCTRIEVHTHPATGQDILGRSYELGYLDDTTPNGVSLLSRITVRGHNGDETETLAPMTFGYTRFQPDRRALLTVSGSDLPLGSLARPEFELVDLTGNGLPDILELDGVARWWRNLGNGRFAPSRKTADIPAGLSLADRGVQLLDADGDGRADLLVTAGAQSGYHPMSLGGLWDRRSFQAYQAAPSFDLEDPEVRLVDLDGDGVTDAVRSGARMECFFNDPRRGWWQTTQVERGGAAEFPDVSFSDQRVKLADMTGDGLQDIVLIGSGSVSYWPARGRGSWGRRITMRGELDLPDRVDVRRILLGDVDGDGLDDLVLVGDTSVTVWINQSGNRWGDPIEIPGTPPVTDMTAVRLTDLLGTGVRGVLWTMDAGASRTRAWFLDLIGGVKPYLLEEIDDRTGAVTRIGYAPSTRFYLEDERRPATRWRTPLPFPVQVVAQVESVDAISGGRLTTEYGYHHGYWDGVEREFRGFGRVDQRDTQTFSAPKYGLSPPTETRVWFHQGAVGDGHGGWTEADHRAEFWPEDPQAPARPAGVTRFLAGLTPDARRDALRALRGRVVRTELYALDGTARAIRPYTVTEQVHEVGPLPGGVPLPTAPERWRSRVFFPWTSAERATQWERGDDPLHRFRFNGDHDAYGQPRALTSVAVPRGRDFRVAAAASAPYLATHTITTYAVRDDDERYITNRVAKTTTYEVANDGGPALSELLAAAGEGSALGEVLAQTLNHYDGPAFHGRDLGELGDHGALVRTERLVLTPKRWKAAYGTDSPPYLTDGTAVAWTAEYPQAFRDSLPAQAGLRFEPGGTAERGWFSAVERRRLDVHDDPAGRGLVTATRDPLGGEIRCGHEFSLLITEVIEETGGTNLVTTAEYDHRTLQPEEITGPNGERTRYAYTPLGLLESVAALGRPDENAGDTPEQPGTRFVYDHLAFAERGLPISARTVKRVHHIADPSVSPTERDQTIETIEFSDGFDRIVQSRVQAEDDTFGDSPFGDSGLPADQGSNADAVARTVSDRVVVSGWRVYDNKGREIERYEPFFSAGQDFAPPGDAENGQKIAIHYDPLGRPVRTRHPDGSETLIVHGVPHDLATPERSAPTPWETWTYDPNDNAGRTHPVAANAYADHHDTPASQVIDALGRTVEVVERNGTDPADWLVTRSVYDLRGDLVALVDPLGRTALTQIHDLAGHRLRMDGLDSGQRHRVLDAAGNVIEESVADGNKGPLTLYAYDVRQRRVRMWARDATPEPVTLRELVMYGDAVDTGLDDAASSHLLGRVHRHYDEAGLVTVAAYDFKEIASPKPAARWPTAPS